MWLLSESAIQVLTTSVIEEACPISLLCEKSTAVYFFTNLLLHVPVFVFWELRIILVPWCLEPVS